MKILMLNHFPLSGSGSGVYVKNIAKSLVQRGHQVCIIMPENTTNIVPQLEGIKIHPVYFKREEKISGQLDFNFPCMDPHPRSNFLFDDMTEVQINKYTNAFKTVIEEEIIDFKPDVIHSQHIWIISGLLKKYNMPYVITSHGAEFITYRKTNIFDKYGFDAVDGCSKIIAISDDNIQEIEEKFPKSKDKILYVKNGYNSKDFYNKDFNKIEVLKEFQIHNEYEKIVLFAGRVSKMKGLDILVKAAKIYEKQNILTLIVGDGDYKEELKNMIQQYNLNNIIFLGNRTHDELNKLYNIADVLVLPSRKEALPLVAIEAMACGTPTIVSNIYGMSNIITKDVGILFDMDNEKMLADSINKVINNEMVFDKNNIINYAKNNYSQEILMDELERIYIEIIR